MIGFFWQENDDFVWDGVQIEPFNLEREREEGYFDADMNFVEYAHEKEIKVNILPCGTQLFIYFCILIFKKWN